MKIWVAALALVACNQTGSLQLDLQLPDSPDLRPTGMTSVSVVATSPDIGTQTNTAILNGQTFSAGDLPVGTGIQVDVLFHDESNRLVGVGEAPNLIDIKGDKANTLSIPVRRPFVYTSSGTKLYSYDPTIDSREDKFQGTLTNVSSPQLAISVGGDRLVVAGTSSLVVVDTATNMTLGSMISIPGTIKDAAQVPNSHRIAVAHSTGISIVDIDTAIVTTTAIGVEGMTMTSVDRVTVGPAADGHMVAYGLIGRVAPPAGPEDACTGTSQFVEVNADSPEASVTATSLGASVSDLAAAPDAAMLFGTLPCVGQVARIDDTGKMSMLASLPRAAVLAVSDQRVWAVGTKASTPICTNSSGRTACTPTSVADCNATSGTVYLYVTTGASLIIDSIPLDGGDPTEVDVPEPRENMVSQDDEAHQHVQELRAMSLVPVDLVTLPGSQYLALVTQNLYYIAALADSSGTQEILPCLKTQTADWMLMDMSSASTAARVRTKCDLMVGPTPNGTIFPNWACEDAPAGQMPTQGAYTPTSVGALFGAR
ncbi:MAG: hypothetical protein QM831_38535 [Kofleriaceae bacterium]